MRALAAPAEEKEAEKEGGWSWNQVLEGIRESPGELDLLLLQPR